MPCRGAPQEAAPGGGRELYCIFAVCKEDTLFVYEKQDPAYPAQLGKELYGKQDGQPILLLCNGSKEDTDTMVTVYCSTGRSLDWNPQLSGSTGQPVQVVQVPTLPGKDGENGPVRTDGKLVLEHPLTAADH